MVKIPKHIYRYKVHGHTCQAVPLVDSKETICGDCDDSGRRQTRLGVGCHVSHGRVRRKLQHHDNILLHLLRKHQRRLQEKILFRTPTEVDNTTQRAERGGKRAEEQRRGDEWRSRSRC